MSHIEHHPFLESFLHILGIFNEEAEGEDIGKAEAEIPTCSHLWLTGLLTSFVDSPHDEEKDGVGNGLVKLSGVAWKHVHTLKDKCPGHIGNLTDDLRVHQVAQADETGGSAGGNSDIVKNGPYLQFRPADIEDQGDNQA